MQRAKESPTFTTWERFEWRTGADAYVFAIEKGGLFATLMGPGSRRTTLPLAVWEGLVDAICVQRNARERGLRSPVARAGAGWSGEECADLEAAFRSGASIKALADSHNRTPAAIEAQLHRLGLRARGGADPKP